MKQENPAPYPCRVTFSVYDNYRSKALSSESVTMALTVQVPEIYVDKPNRLWREKMALSAIASARSSLSTTWRTTRNPFHVEVAFQEKTLAPFNLGNERKLYFGDFHPHSTFRTRRDKAIKEAWFNHHTETSDRAELEKLSNRKACGRQLTALGGAFTGGFGFATLALTTAYLVQMATQVSSAVQFGLSMFGSVLAVGLILLTVGLVMREKYGTAHANKLSTMPVPKLSEMTVLKNEEEAIVTAVAATKQE